MELIDLLKSPCFISTENFTYRNKPVLQNLRSVDMFYFTQLAFYLDKVSANLVRPKLQYDPFVTVWRFEEHMKFDSLNNP